MKYIELTRYRTKEKILINLKKVSLIYEQKYSKTKNITVLDFGNDQYCQVEEDYDTIKEIMEKMI